MSCLFFKRSATLSFLLLFVFSLSGCGTQEIKYKINLEVWGTFEDSDSFSEIFKLYKDTNPDVGEITYRKISPETYHDDLINAMASGTGPDIFMVRNTWLPEFADKIEPAPTLFFNEKIMNDSFVDVVGVDFMNDKKETLAAPLSADSLALYYNRDIFNAAGISTPPKTWEELASLIPKLRKIDDLGNIEQAAIALGAGDKNVNRASDILLTLMLQYGSNIRDDDFNMLTDQQALDYYVRFSRIGLPVYTWNPRQHLSIDAFTEGTLGMMINYDYQYLTIRQKNAKLNFAVAPLPQFEGKPPVNFANYWGFAVAKNKTKMTVSNASQNTSLTTDQYQQVRRYESWQLLSALTLPHPNNTFKLYHTFSGYKGDVTFAKDITKAYLDVTRKPAARRDLIEEQKSDPVLAPFATGNLIAKSWKPFHTELSESLMVEAIDRVARGDRNVSDSLSILTNRYTQVNKGNQ